MISESWFVGGEGALPSAFSKTAACCGNVPVEVRPITMLASESTAIAPVVSMPRASRMLFTCSSSPVKPASPVGSLYSDDPEPHDPKPRRMTPPWRSASCDAVPGGSSDARAYPVVRALLAE
eukprot:scaffold130053_cov54-Phaeocystis_antarctica.AAC.1